MKILSKNNYKSLSLVFGVCLFVSVILRTYELLALTEKQTGFMTRETEPLAYVLLFLIALLAILSALFCLTTQTCFKNTKMSFSQVVASIVLGAGLIADGLLNGVSGVARLPALICTVLQVLSAVYMIVFAFSALMFKLLSKKLFIFPLLFFVFKTATVFISSFYHTVISDTVFDVAAYSFVLLFLLEYLRLINSIGSKFSETKAAVFGILASFFCIVASLPKFLVSLFWSTSLLHDNASLYILPLTTGIFICVLTFCGIRSPERKASRHTAD